MMELAGWLAACLPACNGQTRVRCCRRVAVRSRGSILSPRNYKQHARAMHQFCACDSDSSTASAAHGSRAIQQPPRRLELVLIAIDRSSAASVIQPACMDPTHRCCCCCCCCRMQMMGEEGAPARSSPKQKHIGFWNRVK
ncbi:hypothetical protein IE81DRAFT_102170 [Ceraceosorus guamensis]|uniref:Secreted protein n=1 Tax=Ceraceosorus guamensis TaxID=1522189 RepID=A0A316W1U0_9BASI|nr:hypothetical protein IE81DRAFT_102170 [Ceraceosorus guamensis]PWN43058.1 hypothetical protein IE81DRAFT_102170 [Ceraceosorus guamensis]